MGGAGGDARHAQISFGHLRRLEQPHRVHPLHAPLDPGAGVFPDHELFPQCLCKRGEGPVIGGRAQPAADENVSDLGVVELKADLVDYLIRFVADLRDPFHRVAEQPEPFRHPVGVGVEGEASDQLVPDGHDAGCGHG